MSAAPPDPHHHQSPRPHGHQGSGGVEGVHTEHEDHGWTIEIAGHPPRSDSPEYVKTRALMNKLAREIPDMFYGPPSYQDQHGGALWVKDADGWFLIRNLAGIEWSSQFAGDPARVNLLRLNARRIYALFPDAVEALGIRELLDTPIIDAEGIARWTDSICNASVPLPAELHTGVPPHGGGVHHFPAPVVEISTFKYADFNLWVTDSEGCPAAVAPVAPRGSGDRRVHVLHATHGSALHREHLEHLARGEAHVLPEDHDLAKQAFSQQA